jgi:hypothetical protein
MKKLVLVVIAAVIVVGGGAFYGGMKYVQGQSPNRQFAANIGAGFRNGQGRGGTNGGGFTSGEIISKDDKSITVKMRDGGSKIVFYSNKTEVSKFVGGTATDLEVGKNASINGTANQDGSIVAQSIQLRPVPSPSPSQTPNK